MPTSMYLWRDIFEIVECMHRILSILLDIFDIVKLYSTAMQTSTSLWRHFLDIANCNIVQPFHIVGYLSSLLISSSFFSCFSSPGLLLLYKKWYIFLLQLCSFFSLSGSGMPTTRSIVWHLFDRPHGSPVLLIKLIASMGWILSGLRITHLQSLGMAAARLLKCPIPALDTRYVKAELKFVATGGRVRFCRLCKLPQKTTVFTRPILPDGPSL